MSTPVQIFDGDILYTVQEDCTIVYRALITGSVTDEPFGSPLVEDFSVTASYGLPSRTTSTGLYAITGYAEQTFPKLSSTSYTVHLEFASPAFRNASLDVPIPMNAVFPVPAPALTIQRIPVRIQGRIVANTALRLPIVGALVLAVDGPGTTAGKHATALRTPLYVGHALGATVQEIAVIVSDTATLTDNSQPGATTLTLSKRTGLVAGSILRLFNVTQTAVEYCVLSSAPSGSGSGPVLLRHPLNRSYVAGAPTTVEFINTGAVSSSGTLAVAAAEGDGVLIASQLFTGDILVVDPGTPSAEFHQVGAISDSDGYYALDGIGRLREISLQASHSGFTSLTQDWFLEFDREVNSIDFRL